MKEWWAGLALREKQMLMLGSVCVSLFLLYQLIWSPLLNQVQRMRERVQSEQRMMVWMRQADKNLTQLEREAKPVDKRLSPVALLSLLQTDIHQAGLEKGLLQLKQTSNDAITVKFQQVSFDQLIILLTNILKVHGVTLAQFSGVAQGTSGMVNADMTLKGNSPPRHPE